jgi:hypothetical protein
MLKVELECDFLVKKCKLFKKKKYLCRLNFSAKDKGPDAENYTQKDETKDSAKNIKTIGGCIDLPRPYIYNNIKHESQIYLLPATLHTFDREHVTIACTKLGSKDQPCL